MQTNRALFVTLAAAQYAIYEDDNTGKDGDGELETGAGGDTQVLQKNLSPHYAITWNGTGAQIKFTERGLSNVNKTICSDNDFKAGADYDCIVISATRIKMGKLKRAIGSGGACAATTNCVEK
jgi:hypothetical protein